MQPSERPRALLSADVQNLPSGCCSPVITRGKFTLCRNMSFLSLLWFVTDGCCCTTEQPTPLSIFRAGIHPEQCASPKAAAEPLQNPNSSDTRSHLLKNNNKKRVNQHHQLSLRKKQKSFYFLFRKQPEGEEMYLLWKSTQNLIFLGLHLCFSKCWEPCLKKVKEMMVS